MSIPILFQNNDIFVLNKPAGLVVHSDGKTQEPSVVDFLLEHFPEIKGVGEPLVVDGKTIDRPGIVHRLDRDTSGVLLIAKHQEAFSYLKKQFQEHTIQKEYHAFVWGEVQEKKTINEPIGRNKNDFRRWHAGRGVRGEVREALTHIEPIQSFMDEYGEQFTFLKAHPVTGRTHQIRVHLKYIQRPIVSDALYAPSKSLALGFTRHALHARSVTFSLLSGERVTVEAPYPSDFDTALAQYLKL